MKRVTEFPINRPVSILGKSRLGFVIQHKTVGSLHRVCWSCQQSVSNHSAQKQQNFSNKGPVPDILVQLQLVFREPEEKETPGQLLLKNWFTTYGNFWCYSSIPVSHTYSNSGKNLPSLVYHVYHKSNSDLLSDWLAECFLSPEVVIPPQCRVQVPSLINPHLPHYAIFATTWGEYQIVNN